MYSLEVHIWDQQDTCYRQACLINRQAGKCNQQTIKLTNRLVARGLKLGSNTRVGNGRRNFTDSPRQAGNLQPTLTDHVNIGPDSPKMHSYWPVGYSGTPALHFKMKRASESYFFVQNGQYHVILPANTAI